MNKSTNNFRRCPYCPHHNQQLKCCCKRQKNKPQKSQSTRPKTTKQAKENSALQYSSIPYIVPQVSHFNISSIMAQNDQLKEINKQLKQNILTLSNYVRQQKYQSSKSLQRSNIYSTYETLHTQGQSISLSDKLYMANKNLQQAVIRMDSLSRQNKQLNEKNLMMGSELEKLRDYNQQLRQDVKSLRKKVKKLQQNTGVKSSQGAFSSEEVKILKEKYQNLKFINADLQEEIQKLKQQLCNKPAYSQQNMSPEWIAQTSNKLTQIEKKIDYGHGYTQQLGQVNQNYDQKIIYNEQNRLTLNHKQFSSYQQNQANPTNQTNQGYYQIMHKLKEDLALSINIIQAKTKKFTPTFDRIGDVSNIDTTSLIKNLIETFVENCFNINISLEKDLNRKIMSLEKRLEYLLGRLENYVLEVKNRELRKRSTSRSRISQKITPYNKSPIMRYRDKENFNSLNRTDLTC